MSTPPIQITFLTTGTVRIRPLMRSQPPEGYAIMRRLRSILDTRWTEPIPVGVFLIRHPEGLFLFDTGQSPCCNNQGYFPRAGLFNNRLSQFAIERSDGILEQMHARGIRASDLKGVIPSHLHNDHAGGLEDLVREATDLPIYISREHWAAFGERPLHASLEGATPNHWPSPFTPRIVDFHEDRPLGPWKGSFPVTRDGRLAIVDTSGHVPGHIALVVSCPSESGEGTDTTYLLPGDALYGINVLDREEPDGINDDPMRA
ncbi:beta-lactamase-like protein [Aspergillus heterothallicus]